MSTPGGSGDAATALLAREPASMMRRFDLDYVNAASEPTDAAQRFVFATGGEDFMTQVIGYVAPTNADGEVSTDEALRAGTRSLLHIVFARAVLPCTGVAFFFRRSFTSQSRSVVGWFGLCCAVSCIAAFMEGALQVVNSTKTKCAILTGSYSHCCSCYDLQPFVNAAEIGSSAFVPPTVEDRNDQLFGMSAMTTALIALGMFYVAVRGENPYVAFVAILSLVILVVFRVIEFGGEHDFGDPIRAARVALSAVTLLALVIAIGLLRATNKSFGLIGARRGGLGAGAQVHAWFLINRAASYADQFASYSFYAATFWVLHAAPEGESGSMNTFGVASLAFCIADMASAVTLAVVLRIEHKLMTTVALLALVATLFGWAAVLDDYVACFKRGISSHHRITGALDSVIQASTTTLWTWTPDAAAANRTLEAVHEWRSFSRATVAVLIPAAASLSSIVEAKRSCLAPNTVFASNTTNMLACGFALVVVCRVALVGITALTVRWYYGTRRIAKLFFIFDDAIDDEEKLTVGDVM